MSYDCNMCIDTGGPEPDVVAEIGNMTSNVSPMWTKALGGIPLRDLSGRTGRKLSPIIIAALLHITDPANEPEYSAMNPPNGCGSHASATEYLRSILRACLEHPKAHLHVSC